jgi:hypothetical protein
MCPRLSRFRSIAQDIIRITIFHRPEVKARKSSTGSLEKYGFLLVLKQIVLPFINFSYEQQAIFLYFLNIVQKR